MGTRCLELQRGQEKKIKIRIIITGKRNSGYDRKIIIKYVWDNTIRKLYRS